MENVKALAAGFLSVMLAAALCACGKATPDAHPATCANSCGTPSASVASCCASNGGPQTCLAAGQYDFDCTGKLICSDGTTSSTCTK